MKRWSNGVWALLALLAFSAAPAFAQGGGASSTGSISGEVKDAQGGVLPGVTRHGNQSRADRSAHGRHERSRNLSIPVGPAR